MPTMTHNSVETFAPIISAFFNACNISDINKLKAAHEKTWKEYLNGSNSSQLAAQKEFDDTLKSLLSEMDTSAEHSLLVQLAKIVL